MKMRRKLLSLLIAVVLVTTSFALPVSALPPAEDLYLLVPGGLVQVTAEQYHAFQPGDDYMAFMQEHNLTITQPWESVSDQEMQELIHENETNPKIQDRLGYHKNVTLLHNEEMLFGDEYWLEPGEYVYASATSAKKAYVYLGIYVYLDGWRAILGSSSYSTSHSASIKAAVLMNRVWDCMKFSNVAGDTCKITTSYFYAGN